jgi:hypothetical protein
MVEHACNPSTQEVEVGVRRPACATQQDLVTNKTKQKKGSTAEIFKPTPEITCIYSFIYMYVLHYTSFRSCWFLFVIPLEMQ